MNRSITALALLLTVALPTGYFLLGNGRDSDGRGDPARDAGEGSAATSGEALSIAARPAASGSNAGDGLALRVNVPPNSGKLGAQRFGDWESTWIEGSIQLPAGVPADATLRVLVLSKQRTHGEIHGKGGLLSKLASAEGHQPDVLLAIAETTSTGAFRAPVPSDAQWIWLAIDGRYLYSPDSQRISLPAGKLKLEPEVGAWIHGTVSVPSELETAATLASCSASLVTESARGTERLGDKAWRVTRRVTLRENAGIWTFEHRAVPAVGLLEAGVHCPRLIDSSETGIEAKPGEEIRLETRLQLGASLAGRVLGPSGAPIPNARVRLVQRFLFGLASDTLGEAQSAADGSFLLEGLPAGEASLLADKLGYLPNAPLALELAESEQRAGEILELLSGDTISGIVRYSTGVPAGGAQVRVAFDPAALAGLGALASLRGGSGSAQTDAEGRFEVQGLGIGPFEVTATTNAIDGEFEGLWFGRLAGIKPPEEELELTLHPTHGFRGRVVDLKGQPISAFSISLELEGRESPIARMREATWGEAGSEHSESEDRDEVRALDQRSLDVVDENGEFMIPNLHRGSWQLTANAEGFAALEPLHLELPTSKNQVKEIILAREARISGQVLTPAGVPIFQARVTLQISRQQVMAQMTGSLVVPQTITDAEGHFTLGGLSAGTLGLIANHPDHAGSAPTTLQLAPGQVIEEVQLTLREGGTLSGIVFGLDGDPAAGLEVIVQSQENYATRTFNTQPDGTFRTEHLDPGPYQVTAILSDGAWGSDLAGVADTADMLKNLRFTMTNIVEGEESTVSLGTPPADPVLVRGTVTQAGNPVPNVLVSFTPEKGRGFESMKFAQSDAEGLYETELPAPGRHLISVQILAAGGMEQQQIEYNREIPDEEQYRLDFELPGARISGRIENADGGPLTGARVSLGIEGGIATGTLLGGHYAEVSTDADGRYSFDFLRAGSYAVAAGGAPFGGAFGTRGENGRSIQDRIRVTENEHRAGIDFRLRKGGNIKGTIRDAAGAPVGGASVFVRDERGRLLERFSLISTGPDGIYEYRSLAPGSYRVTARAEGQSSSRQDWVRVREASTATADVNVDAGTMLEVQLIDTAGAELDATLSVTDAEGNEMTGMLAYNELIEQAANGFRSDVQHVGPLPPGKYTLRAETADGRSAEKTVTVRDKSERKIKLRIN